MYVITGTKTGGAEMVLERLAMELNELGVDVVVCSLNPIGVIGERLKANGITVTSPETHSKISTLKVFFHLAKQIRLRKPQIVHTWLYHADLIGGLVTKCVSKVPVIWSLRNSKLQLRLGTRVVVKMCSRLSNWIPSRIVACAKSASTSHIEMGYPNNLIRVIANGYDTSLFAPAETRDSKIRNDLDLDERNRLFGLAGRHDVHKDQHGFLHAVKLFTQMENSPSAHFVLCGEGIDKHNSALKRYVDKEKISDRVHFMDQQEDMVAFYQALDVLVSSSISEGFSNVVAEAMACGVPCIVTDVGDSSQIVGNTGLVVPASDPVALANAFRDMVTMPDQDKDELGKLARRKIEQEYSLDAMSRNYLTLYREVLSEASP